MQDIFVCQRTPWPILGFKQDSPRLKANQIMPLACRDINTNAVRIRSTHPLANYITLVVIKIFFQRAFDNNHGFRTIPMSMNRHNRPGLQRIQHPLAMVTLTVTQVKTLTQPRVSLAFSDMESNSSVLTIIRICCISILGWL